VSDTPATDAFHAHLDICKQCADHPFDLCTVGSDLLYAASKEAARLLREKMEQ
jgi:hypothetical protein